MSSLSVSRRAEVRVKFNNVDITADIESNLIRLQYTDTADEADDLKITVQDRDNIWTGSWLRKELEQRDEANRDIASGADGAEEEDGTICTVTAKIGLNVRKGPGTEYELLGVLPYGQTVAVSQIVDGWAVIDYSGARGYVSAQYLSGPGSKWEIGDRVTANGRAQSSSYGNGTEGQEVTNYQGTITSLNLRSGVPYPICVDSLGWFREDHVTRRSGASAGNDGSRTSHAKYTKVQAAIIARNRDGDGQDAALDCGSFELDDVKVSGPPQTVEISATSLSYESSIRKTRKSRSWNNTSLKGIVEEIGTQGGYSVLYASEYDPTYQSVMQDEQTDGAFLKTLCVRAGLRLKITDWMIVIFDQKELEELEPVRTIRRGDGNYLSSSLESTLSTTAYSSCHIKYEDDSGNTYEATFTPETEYSEGEVLEITDQVSSNEEALQVAKRRLRAANKGEITGRMTVVGDPSLVAGANILLEGWGDFDGKYSIETAVHKVGSGYTTDIELSKAVEGY